MIELHGKAQLQGQNSSQSVDRDMDDNPDCNQNSQASVYTCEKMAVSWLSLLVLR